MCVSLCGKQEMKRTEPLHVTSKVPVSCPLALLSTTPTFPPFLLAPLLCFPRRDRNCESSSTRAFRAWYACRSNCPSTAGVTCSSADAAATLVDALASPPARFPPRSSSSSPAACPAFLLSTEKEEDDDCVNEICRSSGRRTPEASTSVSLSRSARAAASSLASARSSCSFNRRPRSCVFLWGGRGGRPDAEEDEEEEEGVDGGASAWLRVGKGRTRTRRTRATGRRRGKGRREARRRQHIGFRPHVDGMPVRKGWRKRRGMVSDDVRQGGRVLWFWVP